MIKVAFTHDIDRISKTYQYFTKSLRHIVKFEFNGVLNQIRSLKAENAYWTFDYLMGIEEKYKIRSTIFFLNESIKVNPFSPSSLKLSLGRYNILNPKIISLIKLLSNNGWEIGVHGSFNSFRDKSLLKKEKEILESIVGYEIIGIRQHYLNLTPETWKYQKEIGFKYDSSLGYTDNIGFRDNIYNPFSPFKDDFIVIPLTVMDTCFMNIRNKWIEFENLLDICQEKDAVMVINFHQHVFSKYDYPGFSEAYIELIERCKKRNAVFNTLSEIYYEYLEEQK